MGEPVPAPRRKSSSGRVRVWIAGMTLGAAILVAVCLLLHSRLASPGRGIARGAVHAPGGAQPGASPAASVSPPAAAAAVAKTPANPPAASPPPAAPARLAPAGTFYMVEYVAARTPRGIVGFEPGRAVKLEEVHRDKGTLVVSDGRYQAEVQPSQLTNDMDIAELARDRDAASQARLAEHQAAERRACEQASGVASGSPYSYLAPNAAIPPQASSPAMNPGATRY